MFSFSERSKQRRAGIDPRLVEIDDLAITLTLVDFGHPKHAGLRTPAEQFALFSSGRSQCDGKTHRSNHQDGKALDFYAYVDGKASWRPDHLAMVGCAYFQAAAMLSYRIKWGGLWRSLDPDLHNGIPYGWDCPHIELLED